MSRTRYEWTLADFAIWAAGAVTVPIYETSVGRAGAVDPERLRRAWPSSSRPPPTPRPSTRCAPTLPDLRDVWQIDAGALDELVAAGADVSDDELEAGAAAVDAATTSPPSSTPRAPPAGRRAASSPHRNFVDLADNADARLGDVLRRGRVDPAVPAARPRLRADHRGALRRTPGARWATPPTSEPAPDLGEFQPTFILSVPRVFEKVYNSAEQKAEAEGKGTIFRPRPRRRRSPGARHWTTAASRLAMRLKHGVFDRLVYGKLRAALGGQVEYAVSGGARSARGSGHFFRGIGITILEGYGLTETTAPSTVNRPDASRSAPSGQPLPGVRCGSPTTARSWSRATTFRGVLAATRRRRPRPSRTAGSTPATSASSTTTAT